MTGATMNRGVLTGLVALALMLGGLTPRAGAFEACRQDQKLSLRGSNTGSAVLTSSSVEARLIVVTCTGTACVAGLYDTTSLGTATTGTIVIEAGAAASQSLLVPNTAFLENPISFGSGVTFIDDGNVAWVGIYECVQR